MLIPGQWVDPLAAGRARWRWVAGHTVARGCMTLVALAVMGRYGPDHRCAPEVKVGDRFRVVCLTDPGVVDLVGGQQVQVCMIAATLCGVAKGGIPAGRSSSPVMLQDEREVHVIGGAGSGQASPYLPGPPGW